MSRPVPICFVRRLWVPGLQYGDETAAQMDAREAALRAEDAAITAAERAAEFDRARPMPHLEAWAAVHGLWNPTIFAQP